jgi:cytoskeletal protein RodZ
MRPTTLATGTTLATTAPRALGDDASPVNPLTPVEIFLIVFFSVLCCVILLGAGWFFVSRKQRSEQGQTRPSPLADTTIANPSPAHRRIPWIASEASVTEEASRTSTDTSGMSQATEETTSSSASEEEQVDRKYLYGYCRTCGVVEVPTPAGYIARSSVPAQCGGCKNSVVLSDAKILSPSEETPRPPQAWLGSGAPFVKIALLTTLACCGFIFLVVMLVVVAIL